MFIFPRGPSLHCLSIVLASRFVRAAFADLCVHSSAAWLGWSSLPSPVSVLKQYGQSVLYFPHALSICLKAPPFLSRCAAYLNSGIVHLPLPNVIRPALHSASSSMRLSAMSRVCWSGWSCCSPVVILCGIMESRS